MINIPNRKTKLVKQTNRSKILGDIWSSFNLDLQSNLGIIKVSPRLQVNTTGVTNQGLSTAFQTFNSKIFTLADTRIFHNSSIDLTSQFTEDAGSGAITTYSKDTGDLKTFNQTLCATAQTKVMSSDLTGAWTQRATLTTGTLHKLLWFPKFNRLYYFDNGTQIKSLDTSWSEATSGDYFIDMINGYELGAPYTMESDGTDIWVGTMNYTQGAYANQYTGANIVRWDGISSQITIPYKIKARGVLAMCKDDRNIMHAMDTNGALLQFTGSGFEEIGRLPLHRSILTKANSSNYDGFIHPNGLHFTRNGTFIVAVNNLVGDNSGTIKENLQSGIWEFHKDTGFIHRQSFTYNPITTSTITDYGQNRISRIGALMESDLANTSANGNPTLICGATYFTNATTTANGIFVDDPLDTVQKYSYFITSWIQSANVKDTWQKIWLKYRKLLSATDKIILKYRLTEVAPTEVGIAWVNTTTFTTASDISAYSIGDEVEITQGAGGGMCSHITAIQSVDSGTLVVVDEIHTGVTTTTAKARFQKWIKMGVLNDQLTESHQFPIDKSSERVQIKCCMQFTGEDELHELTLVNVENQPLS